MWRIVVRRTPWLRPEHGFWRGRKIMRTGLFIVVFALAGSAIAQTNTVLCRRAVAHTCGYERIFLDPDSILTKGMVTIERVTDPAALQLDEEHQRLFREADTERTNDWSHALLGASDARIEIESPTNAILPGFEIGNLLRGCRAIPKATWQSGCVARTSARYVVSAHVETLGKLTIDLRPGGFAVVFFDDRTYACLADPSHSCIGRPRGDQTLGVRNGTNLRLARSPDLCDRPKPLDPATALPPSCHQKGVLAQKPSASGGQNVRSPIGMEDRDPDIRLAADHPAYSKK